MNVKSFSARTSREGPSLVRPAFGVDAVVLSTKPCAEGIEVLAMAPDSVAGLERLTAQSEEAPAPQRRAAPLAGADQRAMSTLSFQDYVRDRMLKRRHAELNNAPMEETPAPRVESTRSALA